MEFSGERFVPLLGGSIALEHWHRYLFAKELVKGKRVLDIACGEGYGSFMMSEVAMSVIGVDIDPQAINHACSHYQRDNLKFMQGDCTKIPLQDGCIDYVVSYETLEHHDKHEEMLREIKRVLAPDGILVISTPDRYEYSDRHGFHNEFHVKELYPDEFEILIGSYFSNQAMLGQRVVYGSAIYGASNSPMLVHDVRDKNSNPTTGLPKAVYMLTVASDCELPELSNSMLEEPYLESEVVKQLTSLVEQERLTATNEFKRLNQENKRLIDELAFSAKRGEQLAELVEQERQTATAEYEKLNREISRLVQVTNSLPYKLVRRLAFFWGREGESIGALRKLLILILRKVYHVMPGSTIVRNRAKGWLYRRFPKVFSETLSYKLWQSQVYQSPSKAGAIESPHGVGDGFEMVWPENPVVSIVIPIYGKIEYTYRCLLSLWSHKSQYSFEVIIVDDCSPDNSVEVLELIKGIHVVRNETNQGFIRSCNRGVSEARGSLLVMLNNDTVVHSGWLDELVATFNAIPKAGLVGSKLVYPDGCLQEAGGIIWSDGSGWNYGRLQPPNAPEYNYLRDVDYCSGASLMIPKALYDELGGFDEHYAPAYGEDSDLAFRVRQAGYRVLYQPLSQLVHFEGITSGASTESGVKSYQVDNARKLFERWQQELKTHGTPGVEPDLAKDRNILGRALVLDHCTPTPDQDAGSITALNIMAILQGLGFKVTFAPEDNFLFMGSYTAAMQRVGIECLYTPYVNSLEQHLRECGDCYDIVLVFRLLATERNLGVIRKYCPNAKVIFHTSDLHFLRERREAELYNSLSMKRQAEKTLERELRLVSSVDATVVHSSEEKRLLDAELKNMGVDNKVFEFGWAISLPGTSVPFEERRGMVFVGGFQHQPNVDAVVYFVRDVFPLIRERMPDAVFRIVGSKAPAAITELEGDGVELIGYVEDLQQVMDRCRLSVVPLRYGAGIKGKIGTSLSYGLPCVSTTVGAEGMGLVYGDGVLVADDPVAIADAVVRMHEDVELWTASSLGGMDFVHRNYSLESGINTVSGIFQAIGIPESRMHKRELNLMPTMMTSTTQLKYVADMLDDPHEVTGTIDTKEHFDDWVNDVVQSDCKAREFAIAKAHYQDESYKLSGFCRVCDSSVDFLVDRRCGASEQDGVWIPNWRERLVCTHCGLNNRQRMIAYAARASVAARRDRRPDVYLMEQVTSIYHWMTTSVCWANCTGSEYLGHEISSGTVIKGIRHEDVEHLSFADGSFDLILSNDVLEHVVNPVKALKEAYRILRPQGELLMTVPFHLGLEESVRRAEIVDGKLVHLLPEVYHGNPVSDEGSLVFTDFGWDFLEQIRATGFSRAELRFCWSEVYGHLGVGQHYIYAVRD